MPETVETVADDFHISRADEDIFALACRTRAARAQQDGTLAEEIVPILLPQKKGELVSFALDEHFRMSSLETLAKLKGVVRPNGSVTEANASGVNDGACALLLRSVARATRHDLVPKARIVGMATAGVAPRIVGMDPVPATRRVLTQLGMSLDQMDVIEINEAFATQGLAVLREPGLTDNDAR